MGGNPGNHFTRAQRGAERLDKYVPGWFLKVDRDRFDVRSHKDDVLGQVFSHKAPYAYSHGLEVLRVGDIEEEVQYGFDVQPIGLSCLRGAYRRLQNDWNRELDKRKKAPVKGIGKRKLKK